VTKRLRRPKEVVTSVVKEEELIRHPVLVQIQLRLDEKGGVCFCLCAFVTYAFNHRDHIAEALKYLSVDFKPAV